MITFKILDQRYTKEALGLIPDFLVETDPRPAAEQFHDNYSHGGGWQPMSGWQAGPTGEMLYTGESPLNPIAMSTLHDREIIRVYPNAWVTITQTDGSFQISRMD